LAVISVRLEWMRATSRGERSLRSADGLMDLMDGMDSMDSNREALHLVRKA
jgi:hypothetical protein